MIGVRGVVSEYPFCLSELPQDAQHLLDELDEES